VIVLFTGIMTGFVSCIILLGFDINYGAIVLSILFSLTVSIPFGFIIGAFADNQLTAFAIVKLLMAVFLTFPFVSIFVPDNWQWVFYPLPNYWMFVTMKNALAGPAHIGFWPAALITLVSGIALMALLFPKIRKGVKLR
jgi:ABC-2 type transport system permease protein